MRKFFPSLSAREHRLIWDIAEEPQQKAAAELQNEQNNTGMEQAQKQLQTLRNQSQVLQQRMEIYQKPIAGVLQTYSTEIATHFSQNREMEQWLNAKIGTNYKNAVLRNPVQTMLALIRMRLEQDESFQKEVYAFKQNFVRTHSAEVTQITNGQLTLNSGTPWEVNLSLETDSESGIGILPPEHLRLLQETIQHYNVALQQRFRSERPTINSLTSFKAKYVYDTNRELISKNEPPFFYLTTGFAGQLPIAAAFSRNIPAIRQAVLAEPAPAPMPAAQRPTLNNILGLLGLDRNTAANSGNLPLFQQVTREQQFKKIAEEQLAKQREQKQKTELAQKQAQEKIRQATGAQNSIDTSLITEQIRKTYSAGINRIAAHIQEYGFQQNETSTKVLNALLKSFSVPFLLDLPALEQLLPALTQLLHEKLQANGVVNPRQFSLVLDPEEGFMIRRVQ
jgi:hypothetical protein